MSSFKKLSGGLLALALMSSSAWAQDGDLLATATAVRGANAVIELDFATNSEVAGLQFDINLAANGARGGSVGLNNCLSGLSPAFAASSCSQRADGTIRVVILSMSGALIETGNIGSIEVPVSASNITLDNVVLGSVEGTKLQPGLVSFQSEIGGGLQKAAGPKVGSRR